MKYYYHLMIRVSIFDGLDPIDEVNNVLAKYGQPIRGRILERLELHSDVALTLVYKNPSG